MAKDSVMYLFASLLSFYSLILLPIFLVVCAYKLTCRLHKLLGKSRSDMAGKDILRRGLFRVWLAMSGGWITLCAFEFANLPGNCYVPKCDLFVRAFFANLPDYSVDDGFRHGESSDRNASNQFFGLSNFILGN
jgi:hypothetical protein